jgi:glucose/arabinose dehydrogenase
MRRRTRRSFLALAGAVGAGLAGCSGPGGGSATAGTTATETDATTAGGNSTGTGPDPPDRVGSTPLASGFVSPVGVEFPGTGRAYVVDQSGVVYAVGDEREVFLDLRDRTVDVGGFDERGLLGVAFHPEFPADSRVFVRYSAPRREGTPSEYSHTFVLAAFDAAADGADPDSERTLLEIPQPQANHNAGSVAFGPDDLLYVGVGDGGGANDQGSGHAEDWYDAAPGGNGQDVTANPLGSILRLDPDGDPYAVPDDNPLVGRPGVDEQYAWGLRNPWRFSFDGDRLLVADVGQSSWEEVNVVERGGNYGWNVREGPDCFDAADCPTETPDGDPLHDPVVAYPTGGDAPVSGRAVIGGYVYQGDARSLDGRYVFADWVSEGRLFVATPGGEEWPTAAVPVEGVGSYTLAFGRDPDGELYVCTTDQGGVDGETGAVHRLAPAAE